MIYLLWSMLLGVSTNIWGYQYLLKTLPSILLGCRPNWAILFTSYLLVDVMLPRCGDTHRSVVPRASSTRLGRGGSHAPPKGQGLPGAQAAWVSLL